MIARQRDSAEIHDLLSYVYPKFIDMGSITATIKREWLAKIINGSKRVEYRDYTDFWLAKLAKVSELPLTLRLINGMKAKAPEATVQVLQVLIDWHNLQIQFHLGEVLEVRNWEPRSGDGDIDQQVGGESLDECGIDSKRAPLRLTMSPEEMSVVVSGVTPLVLQRDMFKLVDEIQAAGPPPYLAEFSDGVRVVRCPVESDLYDYFANVTRFVLRTSNLESATPEV